ncbi:hypothetical protein ASPCADRAFT_130945 [Aspergillus carbonarius ITEM 5010]|uniref:Uncharacterized protein n=1 Tax=Aspergillus carbonarius (strain ITEM 5010) TaxID=602072 RepID=A0A1R3RLY3_ASPC5|nr:hypothetical protein ASPCADRAFT_130945 [Aspergillus carbonarius ITEM 5010]
MDGMLERDPILALAPTTTGHPANVESRPPYGSDEIISVDITSSETRPTGIPHPLADDISNLIRHLSTVRVRGPRVKDQSFRVGRDSRHLTATESYRAVQLAVQERWVIGSSRLDACLILVRKVSEKNQYGSRS